MTHVLPCERQGVVVYSSDKKFSFASATLLDDDIADFLDVRQDAEGHRTAVLLDQIKAFDPVSPMIDGATIFLYGRISTRSISRQVTRMALRRQRTKATASVVNTSRGQPWMNLYRHRRNDGSTDGGYLADHRRVHARIEPTAADQWFGRSCT